jgi:uncharacterized protein YbjT (DUF2867 family)
MLEKPILLITGGTGLLGSEVVRQLAQKDDFTLRLLVREKANRSGYREHEFTGDLATGKGIAEALAGVSVIIHCASDPQQSECVDIGGTAHLITNLDRKVFQHFIYISIVGADNTSYPYYRSKIATEHLIQESGIPYTIVRATQFHNFVINQIKALRIENTEVFIPAGLKFQPISIDDVARQLISSAEKKATNEIINRGGPEILTFEKLVQDYFDSLHKPHRFASILPSNTREQMFTSGINLVPDFATGKITWQHFLRSRPNRSL